MVEQVAEGKGVERALRGIGLGRARRRDKGRRDGWKIERRGSLWEVVGEE